MSTQSLPAPSLRTGISLPAARLVRWVVNYMIYKAVWLIMPAIFGAEPSFLPALRETPRPSALNAPCLDCASPKAGAIDCRWTDPRTLLAKLSSSTARICMSTRIAIWPPVAGTARWICRAISPTIRRARGHSAVPRVELRRPAGGDRIPETALRTYGVRASMQLPRCSLRLVRRASGQRIGEGAQTAPSPVSSNNKIVNRSFPHYPAGAAAYHMMAVPNSSACAT
jgi:hypothetical protein